jgi:DNA-binding beta-propeller fold protein YncE
MMEDLHMRPVASHGRPTTPRPLIAVAAIAFMVSACAGSGGTSATPTSADTAIPTAAPTAAPTVAPTNTPAPLPALKLLWQGAGPVSAAVATFSPAIDPVTGDVWVAVSRQNQFWIFSPEGKFLEAWGTAGKGPGQFHLASNDPNPDSNSGIAFAPDGSFYVVDTGNYRVEGFDKDRKFVTMWGTFGTGDGQFGNPKGVATDGKTVWVADDPRNDIQAFDTSGHFLRSFPFPFVLFSRAPSGNLFCADPSGILEVDGSGKQVAHFAVTWATFGGGPAQVVVAANGHMFVGIQNESGPVALVEFDATGAVLHEWANGAETMALAPYGKSIYLAYSGPPDVGWAYIQKYALP